MTRTTAAAPLRACEALLGFYQSTSSDAPWTNDEGWAVGNTTDCCSWYGVRCDANHRVVELVLTDNNIRGTLPGAAWSDALEYLEQLDLSRNDIYGTLPDALVNLSRLTTLTLESTNLTGTLPVAWKNMAALRSLSLSYNKLQGTIPDEYAQISTLRWGYLGHNHFNGTVPKWRLCTLLLCGNIDIVGVLEDMDWSSYGITACGAGVQLYLVGTSVSGNIPCIPHVTHLDVGYSLVQGTVPCCSELRVLGAEGTAVSGWSNQVPCVAPNIGSLYLSFSHIRTIPVDFALRFPNLKVLSARSLGAAQPLPLLPDDMTILDIGGNAFSPPLGADTTGTSFLATINISNAFAFLDVSTNSVDGLTLVDTGLKCSDNTSHCAVKLDVFKALGRALIDQVNPANGLPPAIQPVKMEDIPTPMIMLLPDRRIAVHVILNFINPSFAGLFRPRLVVSSLMPHASPLDPNDAASFSVVRTPTPQWNDTYIPIQPCPSGIVMFDDLRSATLLFGVVYRFDMTFVYKPVLLPGPEPRRRGSFNKHLVAGTVVASPCDPASLYAVPLTSVCAACPASAKCDGTSLLHASGPVWRSKSYVLPFYRCETIGCTSAAPRVGTECAPGFTGPLCSNCLRGYGTDTTGTCAQCSSDGWSWTALIVGSIIFVGATTFAAIKSVAATTGSVHAAAFQENSEEAQKESDEEQEKKDTNERNAQRARQAAVVVKHIQNHIGIFALLGRTVYARDRQSVSVALQTIQQFGSQVSLRSVSFVTCLFPDLTAVTQFEALLILMPLLATFELVVVRWYRGRWAWVAVTSSTLLLLYESAINIALQLIPTDDLTFYDASQYTVNTTGAMPLETISTLSLDRRVDVTDVRGWQVGAYIWLFGFGVGFPLAIIACYLQLTQRYGLQYAKDNLGFVTSNFRTKRWYWEEAIMLRKFSLAVGVIALRNYPLAQMQAVICALMLYVVGLEWQVPFSSVWMHHAERVSCYGALIAANVLMAKGSLKSSLEDQSSSYQSEGYTIFMSCMQIITLAILCVLLHVEWKRSMRLGAFVHAEDEMQEHEGAENGKSQAINLEKLSFDDKPNTTVFGFSMARLMQFLPAGMPGVGGGSAPQKPRGGGGGVSPVQPKQDVDAMHDVDAMVQAQDLL